jgi:parallel beta-helix repeat protein
VIKANGSLTISNCKIENASIGINSLLNANYLNAQNVDFFNCKDYSISIAGRSSGMNPTPPPQISYCSLENSDYGISISNLSSIIIHANIITNTDCGIKLSNVSDAQIIGNTIQSNTEELQGIFSSSSGGIFRGNTINGHTSGIFLANSSHKLGGNTISSNKYHGIYIGSGSNPYMKGEFTGNPPNMYAVSGYNNIYENGGYQEIGGPPDNDGSEIYFYNSKAVLINGCNSIVDDRLASPPLINTLLLMNGYSAGLPIYLKSQHNFWGDTVYAARFGNLNVQYIPYEWQPCPMPQGGSSEEQLVIVNQFSQVIDTVYKTGMEVPELSETELAYAEAEEYFLTGELTNALQIYEGIISSNAREEEKYLAYERKYSIGKLTSQSAEFFNELSNTFSTLATNTQDTLDTKILNQFSTLSKVGEQEYETAISEFDNIVQQNPNSEEAVYAEIDALTTALLIEVADSTLQKGRLGKYLIKSTSDYNQKVDEILRKHFGSESKENPMELIPTEYTLYQNYPNPFNPTTTINYDLPNTSDVSLIIYDILGRKVKELVNEKQQAGRYEVQFNASNISSGVYIYQLIAEKYMSSKKMILLK